MHLKRMPVHLIGRQFSGRLLLPFLNIRCILHLAIFHSDGTITPPKNRLNSI